MPISISKLPEVTNVKDNSFMLITQDGTTKRTMCDQFVTEEEARLDEFSPTVITSKSMSKTGEGDNIDYSSSVYDAPMKDVILKGKTLVNCIQEPSSQDVVLPYEFEDGQYVTINDTKESGALGVELKGRTLVNCIKIKNHATTTWPVINLENVLLQPNKKYIAILKHLPLDCQWAITNNGEKTTHIPYNKSMYAIFTSASTITDLLLLHINKGTQTDLTLEELKKVQPMIIEYQEGMENWDIPFFEGMASCKMPILHTVGKNLFDGEIEIGTINADTGQAVSATTEIRSKNFTPINGNPFVISRTDNTGALAMRYYDINKNYLGTGDGGIVSGQTQRTCTPPTNARYVKFKDMTVNLSQKIQIEYNTLATSYEDHKSSILSLPEEVVLRSLPNGVCDTFNMRTNVYTQRVYETTITGTEGWVKYDVSNTNRQETIAFSANLGLREIFDNEETYSKLGGIVCDKLNHINSVWGTNKDIEGISADQRNVIVQIKKTRLVSEDVAGFKTWLTSNNLKVGIQLKVPTITKINLSSTLKSWNTTTHIYSEIPENSLYPILSHSNPTYPVILKPSTKYSIVANSYSNDHTNSAINFNLGGATTSTAVGNRVTTITTPSALTSEELVMSGRGNKLNNVMVIEGDVAGDEPYFEGICDCKTPILLNTGKNLFNIHDYSPYEFTFSGGYPKELNSVYEDRLQIVDDEIHYKTMGNNHHLNQGVGYYIPLKPNTKYTFKASRKFGDRLWALKLFLIHQDERLGGVKSPIQEPTRFGYSNENNSDPVEATFNSSKYNCLMVYIGGGWEDGAKGQRSYIFNDISLVEEGQEIEPYKSNTTTFEQKDDKTIVLRSLPNGVCDTLNVETGEYVQRIGEVVLDGSENWAFYGATGEGVTTTFKLSLTGHISAWIGGIGHCDRLKFVSGDYIYSTNNEGITTDANNFVIRVLNEKASTIEELKSYLKTKPLTVQYELATPIVSTIDVQGFPSAYTNGHVQLSSGSIEQSLTPKVEYNIATNRGGQITQNTKSLIRQGKLLNDIESKINQIIEATINDGVMLMKLRNK